MEELQRKLDKRYDSDQLYDSKPRKVRFKLASSVSGRVLKHVYEDGQELDSPEEKYPHSFHSHKMPRHLEMEQLCGFQDMQDQGLYPPTGLMAQRINVYRGGANYRPSAHNDTPEGVPNSSVLDFGKIIIYTSNLRIIRAPRREEGTGRHPQTPGGVDEYSQGRNRGGKRRPKALCAHGEEQSTHPQGGEEQSTNRQDGQDAVSGCQHCGGSGCAPCSLCHGSKLSMLANRFNESISVLRCQACYPDGLERCQSCTK
ncbi:glutaredoxin domain-containing cysteine-rich protein 2 isoform X1 [Oncorhynchus nerka]|uniref:glutaredoxin domain-containing cysteine-rich protein 2 isoform X1 n=1 Tax=Oncorhynchus nerka TaxID=8023 RepID=UPI0011327F97|nr:glutaredoxin domain-containing cysteine-rich protein 2 isoform X1 [Oncorhynchus nerka]